MNSKETEATRPRTLTSTALYFSKAVECIDARFGRGFAERNPELIIAFVETATSVATALRRRSQETDSCT